ncbi:Protein CLEC16A [Schistosoma japonicum]|nr:Protein CLEC16A [Schistosoma japonicum]
MLIWGNQNDSSVMENILEYFLQFMKEDSSRRICVQLLQTLNILFENMTNQTAICKRAFVFRSKMFFIDYLLSNNHTNAIITHRFDFTDEEVVAYCISFLKILSFRLNINTISFFYIESRREFDLYVEAIKLFAHPESMVRIAVRTITLNVHKVEAVRLIAEMLIWGNQNDSSVMENILEYFLQFMKEDSSRRICVQLLQTLNILFENMTNQTAICKRAFVFRSKMFFIDYLLSNNHTNAIITHRFDFTDEEVVAYCISFLKILSFRLNINTISFFYIESRREFDLYVEAIKLFAHPESMVRIAVRTITLNVHKDSE